MYSIPYLEKLDRYLGTLERQSAHPQIAYYLFRSILADYHPRNLGFVSHPTQPYSHNLQRIASLVEACQGIAPQDEIVDTVSSYWLIKFARAGASRSAGLFMAVMNHCRGRNLLSDAEMGHLNPERTAKPDKEGQAAIRHMIQQRIDALKPRIEGALSETDMFDNVDGDIRQYLGAAVLFDFQEQTSDHKVGLTLPEKAGIGIGAVSTITFAAYSFLWTKERFEALCGEACAESWWATAIELCFSLMSYGFIASLICRFNAERLYGLFRTSVFKAEKNGVAWGIWGLTSLIATLTMFNSPYLANKIFTSEEDPWQLQVFRHFMLIFSGASPFLGNAFAMNKIAGDSLLAKALAWKAGYEDKREYVHYEQEMIARLEHAMSVTKSMDSDAIHAFANRIVRFHPDMPENELCSGIFAALFQLSLTHNTSFMAQKQAQLQIEAMPWYQKIIQNIRQSSGKEKLQKSLILIAYAISYWGFSTNIEQGNNIPTKLFGISEDSAWVNMGYAFGICSWLINGGIGGMAWEYLLHSAFEGGVSIDKKKILIALGAGINAIPGFEIAAKDPPASLFPFSVLPDVFTGMVPFWYWGAAAGSAAYSMVTAEKFNKQKNTDFEKAARDFGTMSPSEKAELKICYGLKLERMINFLVAHFKKIEADAVAIIYFNTLYLAHHSGQENLPQAELGALTAAGGSPLGRQNGHRRAPSDTALEFRREAQRQMASWSDFSSDEETGDIKVPSPRRGHAGAGFLDVIADDAGPPLLVSESQEELAQLMSEGDMVNSPEPDSAEGGTARFFGAALSPRRPRSTSLGAAARQTAQPKPPESQAEPLLSGQY